MLLLETPTEVSATVAEATAAVRSGGLVMIVDAVGNTACLTAALKVVRADAMATFKEHGCGPMRVMASDGLGAVVSMSRDDRADGVPIEAAAQLVDLADVGGAAASTRVADDLGRPVGSDQAVQLADRLGVAIVAAHEILRQHPLEDRIAKRVVETVIPTPHGVLEAVGYASANGDEYVALMHADLRREPTRVHVHVQCQVSDVFGGGACRCGVQLRSALEVLETTRGMVLYVWRTDGERLRHVAVPPSGAEQAEDRPARDAAIARILCDLDVSPVDISCNESLDTQRLSALGVTVQSHRTETDRTRRRARFGGPDKRFVGAHHDSSRRRTDSRAVSPVDAFMRGKFVGARVPRVEDDRFLTGSARFTADVKMAGMRHVAFVRSPYAHARVLSVDVSEATALPGVVTVMTGADLADVADLVDPVAIDGLLKTPQPVIVRDRVRFVGEAVAAVVAEDRYIAEDAAELVVVDYEPLGAVTNAADGMDPDAPVLFDDLGTNIVYRTTRTHGDADAAFAAADRVFEGTFHTNRFMAAPMETRGAIAEFEVGPDRMQIWTSSQTPHLLRMALAGVLGMPEQRIRVITPAVGGGFGQKMATYPEEVVVAVLARRLGCAVKWIEDRRENLTAGSHAKEQIITLEVAVRSDGRILGMRSRLIGDGGAYSFNTASVLIEPLVAAQLMPGVYDVEHYDYEVIGMVTNKTPIGPYRGVGWTAGHSARELLFDEIARGLEMDAAEFRRLNMIAPGSFPHKHVHRHAL